MGNHTQGVASNETSSAARRGVAAEEAAEIAVEGYIYGYPLVLAETSRRVMSNVDPAAVVAGFGASMNQFAHRRTFPDPKFTDVVRPNADTLYSSLWFDVAKDPLIISVPDSGGRYYLLPMLDMWTDVFASPGKRTTGTGARRSRPGRSRLAGRPAARRRADPRADQRRLDHRPHADQRQGGLRRGSRVPGGHLGGAAVGVGELLRAARGQVRPGRVEAAAQRAGRPHGRRDVLRVPGRADARLCAARQRLSDAAAAGPHRAASGAAVRRRRRDAGDPQRADGVPGRGAGAHRRVPSARGPAGQRMDAVRQSDRHLRHRLSETRADRPHGVGGERHRGRVLSRRVRRRGRQGVVVRASATSFTSQRGSCRRRARSGR